MLMCFFTVPLILLLLYPFEVLGGCLGAGFGAGSCPAAPFRADPSEIEHGDGCPQYAECCTEYGYCHPRSSWTAGNFRDCNGESNGQDLPAETVHAERICSGEILEEDAYTSTSPSPQYLPQEERRSGRRQGSERDRKPKSFTSRVNTGKGGGTGHGKRGPQGPVGGTGGIGGHGPAGPNGNCAWDGPGACAGRGKVGGIGGIGGIGQTGWAGPKPNCAWDGPGACKGKKSRTGKKKDITSNNSEKHNQDQLASRIIIGEPFSLSEISINISNKNTSLGKTDSEYEEPIYYDYLDGEPSFDLEEEYNDDNISENMDKADTLQQAIGQKSSLEENLFLIDENERRPLDFNLSEEKLQSLERKKKAAKKATAILFKKFSEPKVRAKSSPIGSDLWTVQQWIQHG